MKEEKKNVVIVHNHYQIPGGEDTVVENEKRLLEKHGHKVVLYNRNNADIKNFSIFKKIMLPFITIFNPKTYKEIKDLIIKEHIDVVHVHNTLNLISPAVYYAAQSMNIPVVQTIHNFRLLCPGATFYRDGHVCEECVKYGLTCAVKYGCYRNSKLQTLICVISSYFHRYTGIYGKINYICLTEFNKSKLLRLKQIVSKKVFVKPNFVQNNCEFVLREKRVNQIVFAGRLDKLKGVDLLFEAWKYIGKTAPKLVVCGTGPMDEWCRKFIQDNDVNIEMRGFLSNLETRYLIANSKALILPTQCYEGFPMSIVEAFSVGTPVICSDIGNCGNLVNNGLNGYKFQHNSVEAVAEAVDKVVNNTMDLYTTTLEEYNKRYTEEHNYIQLLKIYEAITLDRKNI